MMATQLGSCRCHNRPRNPVCVCAGAHAPLLVPRQEAASSAKGDHRPTIDLPGRLLCTQQTNRLPHLSGCLPCTGKVQVQGTGAQLQCPLGAPLQNMREFSVVKEPTCHKPYQKTALLQLHPTTSTPQKESIAAPSGVGKKLWAAVHPRGNSDHGI